MVHALVTVAMTFPVGTGLGWDGIHPMAICRLSEPTLEWLAVVIYHCEVTGVWPEAVNIVVIALLPKTGGGLRPIGLMPLILETLVPSKQGGGNGMRKAQPPLLALCGKRHGADIAAWKQAARAELAAAATFRVGYGEALLDLVKAFDRISFWLSVQEAIALDYPLWFIRLSLETYKLRRVIRIRKVVSKEVQAHRGITAGSGSAVTEMKLTMIRIILKAMEAHPVVSPSCFVDDLFAEMIGPDDHIIVELGGSS